MKTTKTKQFWSLLLALCMVLTLIPPAQAYFDDAEFSVELNYILNGESSENYLAPGDSVSVGDTIVVYPKQQDQYLDVSGFYYDWQVEQPDGVFKTVLASSWDIIGDNRLTITEEMAGKSMRVYVYWDFEYPDTNVEVYSPQWNVDLPITEDYFPDSNFRDFVLTLPGAEDGQFTSTELLNITEISSEAVYDTPCFQNITGIEYFSALESLGCTFHHIESVDLSQNTALKKLYLGGNDLTFLDVSKNTALETLWCWGNQLTELDLSQNLLLTDLDVFYNQRFTAEGTALTDLSPNFDPNRVLSVEGGSFEDGKVHFTADSIRYSYDLGGGFQGEFLLVYEDLSNAVAIDEEHFPDPVFRAYVSSCDASQDGLLNPWEIAQIDVFYFHDGTYLPEDQKVRDLTGLEFLTAVTELSCVDHLLTELDLSQNPALQSVDCSKNQITKLNVSQNSALTTLHCQGNLLTELNLSQNPALLNLNCSENQLTQLDVSFNPALKSFYCKDNQLTGLVVSHNPALKYFLCDHNLLTKLDVSHNSDLHELSCRENRLTQLDVSQNPDLMYLACSKNQLTDLDLSGNEKMDRVDCYDNVRTVPEGLPLSLLSPDFDPYKASSISGGSFDGNAVHFTGDALTYVYDLGRDFQAEFTLLPQEVSMEFSDVDEDDWFYDSVRWAVQNGVTNGYTDGTFRPKTVCMRREVVTFLWNTNGKPEVTDLTNPFKDVKDGQWYTKPILWAVQKGITSGKGSPDLFAPKDNVMRREFVAFLWRAKGCPEPTIALKDTPFKDVKDGQWYTKPILWAFEEGITNGKGQADTFAPKDTCTRAEIVTFLARAYPYPR